MDRVDSSAQMDLVDCVDHCREPVSMYCLSESLFIHIMCWLEHTDCLSFILTNKPFQKFTTMPHIWSHYYAATQSPVIYHYYKKLVGDGAPPTWYNIFQQDINKYQRYSRPIELEDTFKIHIMHAGVRMVASDGRVVITINTASTSIGVHFIYKHAIYKFKSLPLPTPHGSEDTIKSLHYSKGKIIIHESTHVHISDITSMSRTTIKVSDILGKVDDDQPNHRNDDIACIEFLAVNYPFCIVSQNIYTNNYNNSLNCSVFAVVDLHQRQCCSLQPNSVVDMLQTSRPSRSSLPMPSRWLPYDKVGFVGNDVWFQYNQHMYQYSVGQCTSLTTIGFITYTLRSSQPLMPRKKRVKQTSLFKKQTIPGFVCLMNRHERHYHQCIMGCVDHLVSKTKNVQYYCRYDGLVMIALNKYHESLNICI